jgi:uncharacterized membrane protein
MKVSFHIHISKPAEIIFPWLAEPEKAMQWQKNVKSGEIIAKNPEVIGTTFKEEIEEDGKKLEMEGIITKFKQNEEIGFHLESKIHRVDVNYSIEEYDEKSRVTCGAKIKWKFPLNILSILLGRRMNKGISEQLASEFIELKNMCER